MNINKTQLLKMCRGFFLQTVIFTAVSIGGCFYTYHFLKMYGLSLMIMGSLGILPFFYKNTYVIIDDISKMSTDIFEGEIKKITYSDILPYRIWIVNKKDKERSGLYHSNIRKKKLIPVGRWVKIQYLKKSKIIIDFEIIK